MPTDAERIAELHAIVEAVRNRVHGAHGAQNGSGAHANPLAPIHITLPDLMPLVHARDAAEAKVAAIGAVNPRAGGLANRIVQSVKKSISRGLQWFIRDQIVFNRETMTAIEAAIEALAEQNRALIALVAQTNERFTTLHPLFPKMEELSREVKDTRDHWVEWRAGWEHK